VVIKIHSPNPNRTILEFKHLCLKKCLKIEVGRHSHRLVSQLAVTQRSNKKKYFCKTEVELPIQSLKTMISREYVMFYKILSFLEAINCTWPLQMNKRSLAHTVIKELLLPADCNCTKWGLPCVNVVILVSCIHHKIISWKIPQIIRLLLSRDWFITLHKFIYPSSFIFAPICTLRVIDICIELAFNHQKEKKQKLLSHFFKVMPGTCCWLFVLLLHGCISKLQTQALVFSGFHPDR